MSQLMITPASTPLNGAGSANPIVQTDAANWAGETAKADRQNGTESPFAAVLKSRIDKKSAATDEVRSSDSNAEVAKAGVEELPVGVDLSILLPLLAATPGGAALAAPPVTDSASAKEPSTEIETGIEPPLQIAALPAAALSTSATIALPVTAPPTASPTTALPAALPATAAATIAVAISPSSTAALSAAAVSATAAPIAAQIAKPLQAAVPVATASDDGAATPAPAVAAASLPAAAVPTAAALTETHSAPVSLAPPMPIRAATPGAVSEKAPRQQNLAVQDELFSAAKSARPGETGEMPGKTAPDAAINAATGNRNADRSAPLLPSNEFQAVLDSAAKVAPMGPNQGNGGSSNVVLRVDTPLAQPGWHEEVGQQLTWMVGNNRQQADLVLNPAHLGRIEVSLTMNGDQATAVFTSANPAVREALEGSLHRLREVLADVGVSLGQTQVGSQSPQQSSHRNGLDSGIHEGPRNASSAPLPQAEKSVARARAGVGMIDVFA